MCCIKSYSSVAKIKIPTLVDTQESQNRRFGIRITYDYIHGGIKIQAVISGLHPVVIRKADEWKIRYVSHKCIRKIMYCYIYAICFGSNQKPSRCTDGHLIDHVLKSLLVISSGPRPPFSCSYKFNTFYRIVCYNVSLVKWNT